MVDRKQLDDKDPSETRVKIATTDLDYVLQQLNTTLQRGRDDQRLGSHLIKRLRRARAIVTSAMETPAVSDVVTKRTFVQRLKDLVS